MATGWSEWRQFPDPRRHGFLIAPFGPGCYELRHSDSGELVLFGMSGHVAHRMTSLLPKPEGCGTRNNSDKQAYILQHIESIEYRTLACTTTDEAREQEQYLKDNKSFYLFLT